MYAAVASGARHRCEYCHAPEVVFGYRLEVEHIVPRAAGGVDALDHLALACRACNATKASRTAAVDSRTGRRLPLSNPRRNQWEDHFRWSATYRVILGRTPTGWATVAALRMNTPYRRRARLHWRREGLIP